jgi:hypothetical protein
MTLLGNNATKLKIKLKNKTVGAVITLFASL